MMDRVEARTELAEVYLQMTDYIPDKPDPMDSASTKRLIKALWLAFGDDLDRQLKKLLIEGD